MGVPALGEGAGVECATDRASVCDDEKAAETVVAVTAAQDRGRTQCRKFVHLEMDKMVIRTSRNAAVPSLRGSWVAPQGRDRSINKQH